MDDKDHVFARFRDDKPAAANRREVLTIPRRGGASGSRAVEVVHLRTGAAATAKAQPRRLAFNDRAETWENGFPARAATPPPAPASADAPAKAPPVAHVMPMWEPAAAEPEPAPPAEAVPQPAAVQPRAAAARARSPARRVADPFDAEDDGANCLRCGYAIDPAREKRGLMTCAACA